MRSSLRIIHKYFTYYGPLWVVIYLKKNNKQFLSAVFWFYLAFYIGMNSLYELDI